ncbi:MAG: hypothetical protein M1444_02115, partial [Patescibacteria group bacterium]|nr:hypothetical protein [Patescibacteria group bacterium]
MTRVRNILFKNWLLSFCFIIIALQFFQIIFFNRSLFFQKYDSSYWKDRYEHSQYVLPLSKRTIGDDGLYSYAGYRLVNGESIEKTAALWTPVGIYLLGFSILIFNNPLIIEILIAIATVISFYLFSLELLKDRRLSAMTTALLVLDPFIFSNFTIALLDLPQLFFLLLHLLLFIYAVKNTKYTPFLALLSGLSLGFFTETKLPLLLPVIIILEFLYLFKQKLLSKFFWIIFGFTIGIFIPYLRYFELGNSLKDYLRLHKYMISYYAAGKNQLFPLSIWESLLIGYFPTVATGLLIKIHNWWPILPFITIFGLASAIKVFFGKKQSLFLKVLAVFVFALLFTYTIIPSYARYLTLVIPFLYIFSALLLKKYASRQISIGIFIIIAVAGLFYSLYLLIPSADDALYNFKYSFSHQYFQDVYQQSLTAESKKAYTKQQFRSIAQNALANATVKDINFKEISRSIPFLGNTGWVKFTVTYKTADLGTFSEEKTLTLYKEQGVWKIKWDWNLLLDSFQPGDSFAINIIPGKRGTLYDSKREAVAKDSNSILISINPEKIDTKRENAMLKLLQSITSKPGVDFQNTYLENPLPNTYIAVATPFVELSPEQLQMLNSYPGLTLNPHTARLYRQQEAVSEFLITNTTYQECCSRIYSSSNYHGITGVEKQYDKKLSGYNGGTLQMIDKDGNIVKTLINRAPKNGQDI